MVYAENEFYLSHTEKGFEATNRQQLLHLEKSTKTTPPELALSRKPPQVLYHVWQWFCQFDHSEPLTFAEVLAWTELTRTSPTAGEVQLLMKLSRKCHV
jgi:hypothetical protein